MGRRRGTGTRCGCRSRGRHRPESRRGARGGRDRHGDARPDDPDSGGHAASGPARQPDGRRRAGQGRDRGRRAAARANLLRRVGAGEPRRRACRRGRGGRDQARGRDRARQRAHWATPRVAARPTRSRSSTRPALQFRISRLRLPPWSGRTSSTCRRWISRSYPGKQALASGHSPCRSAAPVGVTAVRSPRRARRPQSFHGPSRFGISLHRRRSGRRASAVTAGV